MILKIVLFRYDCRLGRETVTTYQLNVDLQRCAAPNKTADYQKVKLDIKSGVSNTWPAGRMWPARCVCAARDIIKINIIIAETTVFVVKRQF